MTDWIKKRLDAIHCAIANELIKGNKNDTLLDSLLAIKNKTDITQHHSNDDLYKCRVELCKLCRENRMYDCDLTIGYSPNCAFLKSNS